MSKILNIVCVLLIAFILLFPNFVQAIDVDMNLSNTSSANTYTNNSISSTNSINSSTNNSRDLFF